MKMLVKIQLKSGHQHVYVNSLRPPWIAQDQAVAAWAVSITWTSPHIDETGLPFSTPYNAP